MLGASSPAPGKPGSAPQWLAHLQYWLGNLLKEAKGGWVSWGTTGQKRAMQGIHVWFCCHFLPILKDFLGHVGRISSWPGTAGEAMCEAVGVRSCSSEEVSQVIDPQQMSRLSWGTCAYRGKDNTLCWPNKFSPRLTHSTENRRTFKISTNSCEVFSINA